MRNFSMDSERNAAIGVRIRKLTEQFRLTRTLDDHEIAGRFVAAQELTEKFCSVRRISSTAESCR
jgi:hypothetical protein